jgi:hypothetical protein
VAQLKGIRSLSVVREEVRAERDSQVRYFDSIDAKAGILLGFAGALVALSPVRTDVLVEMGRSVGIVSGFLALWTFWPRRYWSTDLRPLRDRYLAAEPEFTTLRLLDTQIDMVERTAEILRSKAIRLKAAMIALAIAVLLTGIGLGVD